MNHTIPTSSSSSMKSPLRQYLSDLGPPTAAYFISVVVAALLAKHVEPGAWRLLLALLPMPATLWMAHAELSRLRRRDELRQRIELEAYTTAFVVSFCLIAALVFCKMFADVEIDIEIAFLLMGVCWLGAQVWVRARYRYWWTLR